MERVETDERQPRQEASEASGRRYGHWSDAGQPVPFANGQQTQTQVAVPAMALVARLVMLLPVSCWLVTSCQSSAATSKVALAAVAVRSTVPLAWTHTTCSAAVEAVLPVGASTLHQER